eukprot:4032873-Alexandrium_andersonii.AAC.1
MSNSRRSSRALPLDSEAGLDDGPSAQEGRGPPSGSRSWGEASRSEVVQAEGVAGADGDLTPSKL